MTPRLSVKDHPNSSLLCYAMAPLTDTAVKQQERQASIKTAYQKAFKEDHKHLALGKASKKSRPASSSSFDFVKASPPSFRPGAAPHPKKRKTPSISHKQEGSVAVFATRQVTRHSSAAASRSSSF